LSKCYDCNQSSNFTTSWEVVSFGRNELVRVETQVYTCAKCRARSVSFYKAVALSDAYAPYSQSKVPVVLGFRDGSWRPLTAAERSGT
jgi:hypothetical protein